MTYKHINVESGAIRKISVRHGSDYLQVNATGDKFWPLEFKLNSGAFGCGASFELSSRLNCEQLTEFKTAINDLLDSI